MNFPDRLLIVSLAAFAAANLIVSACVPALVRRRNRPTPGAEADRLLKLRLLPALASLLALVLTALSFVGFEERESPEPVGMLLTVLGGIGALLIAGSFLRLIGLEWATRTTRRKWLSTARPISLPYATIPAYEVSSRFPLVAVVGVFRPILVIAQPILTQCTPDELAAIVAHEEGHVDRRDNLRRAILSALPDVLHWLPVSRRIEATWDEATEQRADDGAARVGPGGRLYLANALIRVARMVPAGLRLSDVPASALYRGEVLERRINRLLDPATSVAADDRPLRRWPILAAAAIGAASLLTLQVVHEMVEILVNILP